jgi:hypothetical protein
MGDEDARRSMDDRPERVVTGPSPQSPEADLAGADFDVDVEFPSLSSPPVTFTFNDSTLDLSTSGMSVSSLSLRRLRSVLSRLLLCSVATTVHRPCARQSSASASSSISRAVAHTRSTSTSATAHFTSSPHCCIRHLHSHRAWVLIAHWLPSPPCAVHSRERPPFRSILPYRPSQVAVPALVVILSRSLPSIPSLPSPPSRGCR